MLDGQSCLISPALPSCCKPEQKWVYMTYLLELSTKPVKKQRVQPEVEPVDDPSDCQTGNGSNDGSNYSDSNSLFSSIGRDNSIDCLLRCSRSEYGSLACLNRGFRSLIQGGELYRLRRKFGIVEHWVYFSCNHLEWIAYDPKENRWMTPPRMPHDEWFVCADKESLAVGTELLVFGVVFQDQIVLRYSILSNSWTRGVPMNQARCLFSSASLGEKAIVAGGTDMSGNVLNSAELYNSETRSWVTINSMNKARKMCSGVFMDGKFYVVGGASSDEDILTCGEEYDLEKQSWRVIPNMAAGLNRGAGLPPLVAVLRNELYTADCLEWVLKKYDKKSNVWVTLGPMPLKPGMREFFNVAFCACGDRLLYTNDFRVYRGGRIWINSCVPDNDGPPQWNIITERDGIEVTSCIAMGC
ncbi:Galactose oxidase/kelch repeat superfamily protein [Rhynchospora pubera]|uniref:Galactose oxidase/kelch repeat superfamily protein n=1 Tax=Rhynchospora pubera TaxID=906938 RepID=A0AAV8G671_9POAL|nr:Galactose oxidase/kelch repeat superfamily protein [Rhynchospora pubera]